MSFLFSIGIIVLCIVLTAIAGELVGLLLSYGLGNRARVREYVANLSPIFKKNDVILVGRNAIAIRGPKYFSFIVTYGILDKSISPIGGVFRWTKASKQLDEMFATTPLIDSETAEHP